MILSHKLQYHKVVLTGVFIILLLPLTYSLTLSHPNFKGTMSRLCARTSIICFFLKRQLNCRIYATRFPSRPHRDGDLLFTFSSNILDFRRSPSPYLKFGSRHEDLSRFCRMLGLLATRKAPFTLF